MTPEVQRLLDLATGSLVGREEAREEAKGELMARLNHGGTRVEDVDLQEPLERLARYDGSRRMRGLKIKVGLAVGFLLVLGAGIAWQVREIVVVEEASRLDSWWAHGASENLLAREARRKAPDLPIGLETARFDSRIEEAEALRARHPDDLGLLQEWVLRNRQSGASWERLEPQLAADLERLDAGNGLWLMMEFEEQLKLALIRPGRVSRGSGPVHDEGAFVRADRLFGQLAAAPYFMDHSTGLRRRQLDALPQARSLLDELVRLGFGAIPSRYDLPNNFSTYTSEKVRRFVEAGDVGGLQEFAGRWERITRLLARSESFSDEYSIQLQFLFSRVSMQLREGLKELASGSGSEEFDAMCQRIDHAVAGGTPTDPELELGMGVMIDEVNRRGRTQLAISAAEIKPSRMAEYAWADRFSANSAASVFCLLWLMVGFEALRRPRRVRGLATGLMPLLGRVDQFWIGGLGVLLPWLWWWGITRLTPFGLRDIGLPHWSGVPYILQNLGGLLFAVTSMVLAVRWRWSVRGKFLGMGRRHLWVGLAAVVVAALTVPAVGSVRYLRGSEIYDYQFMMGVTALGSLSLLWLLWGVLTGLCLPRSSALQASLTCRSLLPWFAIAGMLMILCMPGLWWAERSWFAKDRLVATSTSATHLNAFEEREVEATSRLILGEE